jgi:hypothetical protein
MTAAELRERDRDQTESNRIINSSNQYLASYCSLEDIARPQ